MKQELNRSALWNAAGVAGIALGAVPVAHLYLTRAISGIQVPAASLALTFLLWAVKFGGCIWLMLFFMKKFHAKYRSDNRDVVRFGIITSFCSALIFSGIGLADMLVISPDYMEEQFAQAFSAYSSLLDSNSMAMLEKMKGSIPQISFFSNLIYCFLYGTVLSVILAGYAAPKDPFAGYRPDSGDNRENGESNQ